MSDVSLSLLTCRLLSASPRSSTFDASTCTRPFRLRPGFRRAVRHALPPHRRPQRSAGTVDDPEPQRAARGHGHGRNVATGLSRTVVTGRGRPLRHRRAAAGRLRDARRARRLQAARAARVQLTIAQTLVAQHHAAGRRPREEVTVVGATPARQHVDVASSATSSASEAIEQLPLNGRNYTDLALLQPGVIAYPHRDGGSVVAHGLGMSVNGQDPRSNVYLLDGTLLNDFTNGPAGSAAGTALGMETIREFRVETNAYSAEFGRNSGGQINVLTKSGTNDVARQRCSSSTATTRSTRATTSTPASKPDFTRNQFGGTLGGPLAQDRLFFFVGYEALRESLGRTISHRRAGRQRARAASCPTRARCRRQPGGARRTSREYPRPTAPSLGSGIAATRSRSTRRSTSTSCRARRLQPRRAATSSSPATRSTTPTSTCRPTTRSSRATFLSRNQFFTGEYRRMLSRRTLNTARLGFSRTRVGQNVEANTSTAAAAVRARPRHASATSTSAACSASGRRARPTCGSCRTCSACRTTSCTRAAVTCSRPAGSPSATRTTW